MENHLTGAQTMTARKPLRPRDKAAMAAQIVYRLFKTLSVAQCLLLQLLVAIPVWSTLKGGMMAGTVLPVWAIAASAAGYATVLLVTFLMGHGALGLWVVGACALLMLGLGSASVTVAPPHSGGLIQMPSMNDFVTTFAWIMAGLGVVAGLLATFAYADDQLMRRADPGAGAGEANAPQTPN